MIMERIHLFGIWFLPILLSLPAEAQLQLSACQEKARANYPLIRQLALIEKTAEYNISNANKGYLPQLSVTAI